MISSNPKTKTRTNLFFDQWRYSGQFYLPEANALRSLNHSRIDQVTAIRKQWNRRINFGGSWNSRYSPIEITAETVKNLHDMCDFLLTESTPKKIVLHTHHMYIYTNDLNLFERIGRMGICNLIESNQVEISGVPNTIVLKNPRHQYRSYFRSIRMEPSVATAVHKFLSNQTDLRLSPSLKWWTDNQYRTSMNYYFIDHDGQSVLSMLGMIEPKLVRKTVPITAAK